MAAVGDGLPEEEAAAGVCGTLGSDELRLIFAALLTTRNCEKDVGRCVHARHWRAAAARSCQPSGTRRKPPYLGHAFWKRPPLTQPRDASASRGQVPVRVQRVVRGAGEHAQVRPAEGPKRAVSRRTSARRLAPLTRRRRAPSLWFKLFSMLDPTEAARAAAVAPAPAPGALAKRGSGAEKDFRDNDFQRRFVEQFCALRSAN